MNISACFNIHEAITSRIRGKDIAPESRVGEFVLVDLKNFPVLVSFFFLLFIIFHFCNRSNAVFGDLISVTSVIFILSYLVRMYVSFPTDILR